MDKQEPVDCIHPREITQYTGGGDELAFCPDCGQNRLTGYTRATRPADDGLEALTTALGKVDASESPSTWEEAVDELIEASRSTITALRAQSDAEVEREAIRIQARKEAIEEVAEWIKQPETVMDLMQEWHTRDSEGNLTDRTRENIGVALIFATDAAKAIRALGEGVE